MRRRVRRRVRKISRMIVLRSDCIKTVCGHQTSKYFLPTTKAAGSVTKN